MSVLMKNDEMLAALVPSAKSTTITGTTNSSGNLLLFSDSSKIILSAYCTSMANVCLSVNRAGSEGGGALWASANERGTMNAIANTSLTVLVYYLDV